MSSRYFYRVDSNGDPISGSNIKSIKKPNYHYRELLTVNYYCCNNIPVPIAYGKRTRFFIRLDENRLPITGSLRQMPYKPTWGEFQEVVGDYCCVPESITIVPDTLTLNVGATQTYSVIANYTSGRTQDITSSSTFVSSVPSVASILNNIATGVSNGSTVITATFNTLIDTSNLTVGTTPSISVQPTNQSVTAPATATFIVTATGSATLTYQWYKNNVLITGATTNSYTTPATVLGDSGAIFKVIVTNNFGTATSSNVTLTVA